MNNTYKRLLTFFIGIPVVLGVVFLHYYHHLALNIFIVASAIIGSNEFYNMLSPKYKLLPKPVILTLSGILPLFAYLCLIFNININTVSWIFVAEIIVIMGIECFTEKEFSESVTKLSLSLLILFYTGFILTFVTRMTSIEKYSTYYIALFFIVVFMCDSLAWFFGVLFGKSTRGYVAVSPNKSLVGFVGGIVGSILSAVLLKLIFPEPFAGAWWKIILLAFLCGLSTIVGDLIESVFKRSTNVKDSGNFIPGRGGVLDSIDSLLATAPIFYILLYFLYLV